MVDFFNALTGPELLEKTEAYLPEHSFAGSGQPSYGPWCMPSWVRPMHRPTVHEVIATAKRDATPKVGIARTILLKQHVHTRRKHGCHEKIVAIERIGQHHISRGKGCAERAQQSQLAAAFARMWPDRRIDHGAGRQTNHPDDTRQRKAGPPRLGYSAADSIPGSQAYRASRSRCRPPVSRGVRASANPLSPARSRAHRRRASNRPP